MTKRAGNILLRVLITALCLALWFWTQSLLGARPAPVSGIGDAVHHWTATENAYLHEHPRAANLLLIVSSAFVDLLGLFLLLGWLFGKSVRPFLGLVLLMLLRQSVQGLTVLGAPEGMIWHDPGFPSLLVTYSVSSDFFFSGHTAIAVFGASELARLKNRLLTAVAVVIALFEIGTVLVLRAHYTMDVFTGILTALLVRTLVDSLAAPIDQLLWKSSAAADPDKSTI